MISILDDACPFLEGVLGHIEDHLGEFRGEHRKPLQHFSTRFIGDHFPQANLQSLVNRRYFYFIAEGGGAECEAEILGGFDPKKWLAIDDVCSLKRPKLVAFHFSLLQFHLRLAIAPCEDFASPHLAYLVLVILYFREDPELLTGLLVRAGVSLVGREREAPAGLPVYDAVDHSSLEVLDLPEHLSQETYEYHEDCHFSHIYIGDKNPQNTLIFFKRPSFAFSGNIFWL